MIRTEDLTAIRVPLFFSWCRTYVFIICACAVDSTAWVWIQDLFLHQRKERSLKKRYGKSRNLQMQGTSRWVGEILTWWNNSWWGLSLALGVQTRSPQELWPLCNQATLHPRPSWLCNGKRESISSYSAANQSSESTRPGTEDCISYVHEEEEETAGAWDGAMLGVRGFIVRERQLVMLHYRPAE